MPNKVYFENIHVVIHDCLLAAHDEILLAVAWFTDPDLFDILLQKSREGLKVEVIISNNEDNKRLPFQELMDTGAKVTYLAGGYGMMHHKFCLIDNRTLLNGSYNWTVNAKKNNNENISLIDDPEVIAQFREEFYKIQYETEEVPALREKPTEVKSAVSAAPSPNFNLTQDEDFDWDIFLNSHVQAFDREQVCQRGYNRAIENNGNEIILHREMDSLFSQLLTDTVVNQETIEKYKKQVAARCQQLMNEAKEQMTREISLNEAQSTAKEKENQSIIHFSESDILKNELEKAIITDQLIPNKRKRAEELNERINQTNMELVKPPIKWYKVIPTTFILSVLSIYLFFFYSATIYTILHGYEDTIQKMQNENEFPSIELFNPEAIELAYEKGWMTVAFIIVFTSIPFACGILKFNGKTRFSRWAGYAITFLLDVVIAYMIAKVMHQVSYLAGQTQDDWLPTGVFTDINFYLVILLGFVAYLVWGFLYDALFTEIEERNSITLLSQRKTEIKLLNEQVSDLRSEIEGYEHKLSEHEKNIVQLNATIRHAQNQLHHLPYEIKHKNEQVTQLTNSRVQSLQDKRDSIITYLERDHTPVSLTALRDRINVFMEGWDKFLHEHYSIRKATEMSGNAHKLVEKWYGEKREILKVQ